MAKGRRSRHFIPDEEFAYCRVIPLFPDYSREILNLPTYRLDRRVRTRSKCHGEVHNPFVRVAAELNDMCIWIRKEPDQLVTIRVRLDHDFNASELFDHLVVLGRRTSAMSGSEPRRAGCPAAGVPRVETTLDCIVGALFLFPFPEISFAILMYPITYCRGLFSFEPRCPGRVQ